MKGSLTAVILLEREAFDMEHPMPNEMKTKSNENDFHFYLCFIFICF